MPYMTISNKACTKEVTVGMYPEDMGEMMRILDRNEVPFTVHGSPKGDKDFDKKERLLRLHLDLTWLMQSFDITLEQRDYIDEVCWVVHQAKRGEINYGNQDIDR